MDNVTPLDQINTKLLALKIKDDLSALTEDAFLPNTREEAIKFITPSLESLKTLKAINDFHVEVTLPIWEDRYSMMPERLLAIEASERFGSQLEATEANIERVRGYPYRFRDDYWLIGDDGDEYAGCSDTSIPPDEPHRVRTSLVIDDPTHQVQVDLYIQPIEPVQFVTFSLTQDIHECF